jgi:hypothetical protein
MIIGISLPVAMLVGSVAKTTLLVPDLTWRLAVILRILLLI